MARKQINKETYTQINTDTTDFLIQNISSDQIVVVISDTKPADNADFDFVLNPTNAIGGNNTNGTVWAKTTTFDSAEISVVEG